VSPLPRVARCRSASSGSAIEILSLFGGGGVRSKNMTIATSPMLISTATPKNGPRQLMPPSSPPTSGPSEMPRPSAASYSTTAPATPPAAEPTITDRAVAMKSAFPRPQPARRPTIAPMLFEAPAAALKAMMRPATSVRLAPMRLATTLETSIEMPVNAK
jgi:hypothetical protein